jgi:hypothetical protein
LASSFSAQFLSIGAALLLMALFSIWSGATLSGNRHIARLGFRPPHVRRMLLAEGVVLWDWIIDRRVPWRTYAKAMLYGFRQSGKAPSAVRPCDTMRNLERSRLASVAHGGGGFGHLGRFAQTRGNPPTNLAEGAEEKQPSLEGSSPRWSTLGAMVADCSHWRLSPGRLPGPDFDAGLFFCAGGLLLISGWAASASALRWLNRAGATIPSPLAWLFVTRRDAGAEVSP